MTNQDIDRKCAELMGWTNIGIEDVSRTQNDGSHCLMLVGRKPGGVHDRDIIPMPTVSANDDREVLDWVKENWDTKHKYMFSIEIELLARERLGSPPPTLSHAEVIVLFSEKGDYAKAFVAVHEDTKPQDATSQCKSKN